MNKHVTYVMYNGETHVFNENEHWAAFEELGRGQIKSTEWKEGPKP